MKTFLIAGAVVLVLFVLAALAGWSLGGDPDSKKTWRKKDEDKNDGS